MFNTNPFVENRSIMEASTGFTLSFSSASFFAVIKTLVSSAYITGLSSLHNLYGRLFTFNIKSMGPKIEPFGMYVVHSNLLYFFTGDRRKWKRQWNAIIELRICLKWQKSGVRLEMRSVKQPLFMQKQEANMMQQSIMWMQRTASRNLIQMVGFVFISCNFIETG
jgi:hypothetical protein